MRLEEKYKQEIVPLLMKEWDLKNPLAVPKVTKVVVNVGLKEAVEDKSALEKVSQSLALITGQKPKICRAKRAIAGFKLRAGAPIGLMVTLRRKRMYDFLEKLFHVVLPRIKDFHGVSPDSFDGHGNYTLGLEEQTVFPEIDPATVERIHGLEVTIVTNTDDDQKAKKLLALMAMPFADAQGKLAPTTERRRGGEKE